MKHHHEISVNNFNYTSKTLIGNGSNGSRVFKIQFACSDQFYALKKILISTDDQGEKCQNEISIFQKLAHPNIITYYDSIIKDHKLYILLEYAEDGDLRNIITKHKTSNQPFTEYQIISLCLQIANSIEYIHSKKILHRDIKPENVFLSKGIVKLGDFGISKELNNTSDFAMSAVGTPYYVCPEICRNVEYNYKSDIWSFGCLMYELCSFERPFVSENISALLMNILKNEPKILDVNSYSKPLIRLVMDMINKDPNKRPEIKEIRRRIEMYWGKDGFDNFNEAINVDVNKVINDNEDGNEFFNKKSKSKGSVSRIKTLNSPQNAIIQSKCKFQSKLFTQTLEQMNNNNNNNSPNINNEITNPVNPSNTNSNKNYNHKHILKSCSINNDIINHCDLLKSKNSQHYNNDNDINNDLTLLFSTPLEIKQTSTFTANDPSSIIMDQNNSSIKRRNLKKGKTVSNEYRRNLRETFLLEKFGKEKFETLISYTKTPSLSAEDLESKKRSLLGNEEYNKYYSYIKLITDLSIDNYNKNI